MEKKELDNYKKLLVRKREEVVGELNHLQKENLGKSQRDASGDLSGYSYHMADVATDNFDREFSLDIASAEQNVVYEIDEALRRIKENAYGECITCGKKIPQARLKAIPHTSYCLKCQAENEKSKK